MAKFDVLHYAMAIYYSQGLSRKEITGVLRASGHDVSQHKVGRAIREMIQKELIRTQVCVPPELEYEVQLQMRDVELERRLARVFGLGEDDPVRLPPRGVVAGRVRKGAAGRGTPGYDQALEHAASIAALVLVSYLEEREESYIGISWGQSVQRLVDKVTRLLSSRASRRPFKNVTVFSTVGDIVSAERDPRDFRRTPDTEMEPLVHPSSRLATKLANALGADLVTFHGPGWIPLRESATLADVEHLRSVASEFLASYEGYRLVFDQGGLLERADVLITGVGSKATYEGQLVATKRSRHPYAQAVLERSIGDLSGVPLTRYRVDDSKEAELVALTYLGCEQEHFRRVFRMAKEDSTRLGVLAVAAGEEKVDAAYAACLDGLVNVMFTDSRTATQICELKNDGSAGQ